MKRASDVLLFVAAIAVLVSVWRSNQRIDSIEDMLVTARAPVAPQRAAHAKVDAVGVEIGSPTAPVTIVQFTDYECPFCKQFAEQTLPILGERYIDRGTVRLVIRDLPLPNHRNARELARAARCASELTSESVAFQLALYQRASEGAATAIGSAADSVGIDEMTLRECMDKAELEAAIQKDVTDATKSGLTATPSFVVGVTAQQVSGPVIHGAMPFAVFETHLDSILRSIESR